MAHITGHVRIAAPPEQVFDTVADSRNEPSFNPATTHFELATQAPIGLGTRFRAHMGKADTEMVVELTEFERPHQLMPDWVMARDWRVRSKGRFRLLGPLIWPLGGHMERRIWTGLKQRLEIDGDARTS